MSKSESAPSNNNRSEVANERPTGEELASYYPYPAIPHSVRPYLERNLQIDGINSLKQGDEREVNRLNRLNTVNRVLGLTRAYCRAELNGSAYKAAALGGLEDSASGLGGRRYPSGRASEELGRFFVQNALSHDGNIYNNRNIYIAGLLQDRRRLDRFREEARSSSDPLDYEHGAPAPSTSEWLKNPQIATAETLYNAVSTINIESMLISGCETLAKLQDSPASDRETLDLVRYSEQLIAPVAEVIGFDTLAMSLNSTTKSIRLTNGGQGYLLHRADALIDRYRNANLSNNLSQNVMASVDGIVHDIYGNNDVGLGLTMPVDYGEYNQSVYGYANDVKLNIDGEEVNTSWRYRLKSPGSLAWKLYHEGLKGNGIDAMPMDVLGITVIAEDDDDQKKIFKAMVDGAAKASNITPYHSPSKASWIHVRGTPGYIANMTDGLAQATIDTHIADSANDMHYAKITGFYGQQPFELQCVTRAVRSSMQIGPLAHVIYKANAIGQMSGDEVERWTRLLSRIRGRRDRIGELYLIDHYADNRTNLSVDGEKNATEYIASCVKCANATAQTLGTIALNNWSER